MKNRLRIFITLFITAGVLGLFFYSRINNPAKTEKRVKEFGKVQQIKPDKAQTIKRVKRSSRELSSAGKINKIKRDKYFNPLLNGKKEAINEKSIKEDHEEYSDFEKDKEKLKGLVSQREEMIEEGNKADHPDLFAKYERDIRTREGRSGPDYPRNYKIEQILKTRHMTSTKALNKVSKVNALNWVERGPGNVSGRTRGIIVDPDDATFNTWFAGSVGGGVWKTTNAGASWTNLTPDITNLATSTIAMAMSNHNVIYAGTGEGFFNADQIDGTGIWKSTNKGATWEQLPSTANNILMQNITRIIVDPNDENTLLATATPGFFYTAAEIHPPAGIFRSTNGGTSWDMVYNAGENSVEDIIANPENFNTQYATINSVGVVKSLDGGKTWKSASNGIDKVLRMEIAIAPTDTSTLYFAAEGGSSGSILYVSDDAAANWYALTDTTGVDKDWLGGQGWYDNCIAVDPYDKNVVYVGGVSIFRLTRIAGSDTSANQVTKVDLENTSSFLSFINWNGPYNGGSIGTGNDFLGSIGVNDTDYVSVELRFGPGESQKAYRFVYNAGVFVYKDYVDVPFEVWDITHNRQLSFSFRDWANNGVFDLIPYAPSPNTQREYMFVNAVPYSPTANTSLAKDDGAFYKNIYAIWPILATGGTWDPNNLPASTLRINWGKLITKRLTAEPIADVYRQFGGTSKGVHPDQHNITLVKTNEATHSFRLVNGNDGGVSYSDDKGTTFTQPRNGYNTTQFYGVDKMNGADRYIGGTQDNGSWFSPMNPTDTSSWMSAPSGDGFEAIWKYDNANDMLESSQFNNIFKSTDGGMTWAGASSSNGLADVGNNAPFITKLAKSKQDPDMVFAIGASGVWRSDDFASSWTLTPIDSNFSGSATFAQIKMSLVNPQIVWTGSGMSGSRNIFVSADGGLTFKPTNNYASVALGSITNLETDPVKDSTAYVLFSFAKAPKILKTTDLGQTWTDLSGFGTDTVSSNGFPDVAVYSLLVMPYDPNIIWAGTDIGIYQSTDGGGSWSYTNNGAPATSIYEMVIVNDEVIIATHGRGIWSVKIPELSGYEPPAVTKSPRLDPVAQNPSGMLVIPFSLRSSYDSTHVMINKNIEAKLLSNPAVKDTSVLYPVMMTKEDSIQVISYKNGIVYKSYERISDDKVFAKPSQSYANNFNMPSADFAGSGFTIDIAKGFSNGALNSPHPYADNNNYIAQLLTPIIVSSMNATISYNDIAIVEPGDPGSVFGDNNFWDYVIVEGTKDGLNWQPLINAYDSREDSSWFAAFMLNGSGDSTMFRNHIINLLNTFSAGDTILVRFRLFADEYTHGWGWAIDNLVIQGNPVPVELTSFTANTEENKITLSWETATEKNNAGFDIERSSDKKDFYKIGNVQGRGTTTEKQSYSYTDKISGGGKFYYRLKQIDYNGSFTYSTILEVSALPAVFSLSQNYPNPFNPSTTIKYQLPQKERVVLEIYNTLGEKVKTLVDDIRDPGFYEAKWDGTNNNNIDVATGVYIYRIMAGKFVLAKKMMFLK